MNFTQTVGILAAALGVVLVLWVMGFFSKFITAHMNHIKAGAEVLALVIWVAVKIAFHLHALDAAYVMALTPT